MDFLKEQPGPFRFEIKSDETLPNLGAWEGLEASDGYLASVSRTFMISWGKIGHAGAC